MRFIELDLHDNDFAARGDYGVGHDAPGNQVQHGGGNPAGDALRDWLRILADFQAARPDHLPITLGLDIKDNLVDQADAAAGNPGALNAALREAFGDRLFTPRDLADRGGVWPSLCALRGRVLVVLSGDATTRAAYRRDVGQHPAVAVNARGQLIEVHDNGGGDLWYWVGHLDAAGRPVFTAHGRYDTGTTPAVALDDDGLIVEVHQSENEARLWAHVGVLTPEGDVRFGPSAAFDDGVTPSVRFVAAGGPPVVREIHASQNDGRHWDWRGEVDLATLSIRWDAATHGRTDDALFRVDEDAGVRIHRAPGDRDPADTLRIETPAGADRVRYAPLMFVEVQPGSEGDFDAGEPRVYACSASSSAPCAAWRAAGGVVRQWDFAQIAQGLDPPASFPATNEPDAAWYRAYLAGLGAATEP